MNEKNKKSSMNPVSNMNDCNNCYSNSVVNKADLKSTAKKETSKSKKNNHSSASDCK